jgi:hypothetical protein
MSQWISLSAGSELQIAHDVCRDWHNFTLHITCRLDLQFHLFPDLLNEHESNDEGSACSSHLVVS